MKIRKIQIGLGNLDNTLREAGEVFEQVSAGKDVKHREAIYFGTIKEMRRVLTEKRLELIKTVKDCKPISVYELAKLLRRELKNVLQDVSYLQELGIVEVEEQKDRKIPHVPFDKISFEVAL